MVVVHHLNNSRSQRVLWLLEELAVPYEVKRYERDVKMVFNHAFLISHCVRLRSLLYLTLLKLENALGIARQVRIASPIPVVIGGPIPDGPTLYFRTIFALSTTVIAICISGCLFYYVLALSPRSKFAPAR